MKELLLLPLSIIGEIFEGILEAGVDACPPLLLFACVFIFVNNLIEEVHIQKFIRNGGRRL